MIRPLVQEERRFVPRALRICEYPVTSTSRPLFDNAGIGRSYRCV